MRLFFIRHAESINNVAGQHSGVSDPPLTAHGTVQAHRLADRLANDAVISHVFSSPLTCSLKTAEAITDAQNKVHGGNLAVIPVCELHGEGNTADTNVNGTHPGPANNQPALDNIDWVQEMRIKADCFLDNYLIPLLCCDEKDYMACAVITQGNELNIIAKVFFDRIPRGEINLPPDPEQHGLILDPSEVIFPPWAIMGVLDVVTSHTDLAVVPPPRLPFQATIKRVNCRSHLRNLQKTRGGIGSAPFDARQRTIHNFFTPLPKTPRPHDLFD